jgi:hypothetical protein
MQTARGLFLTLAVASVVVACASSRYVERVIAALKEKKLLPSEKA